MCAFEQGKKGINLKVIVAAAGTGGHINPGIAIANKIMEEEPDSEILFIGTERGIEKDLVPRAGFELKTIESYGISKKITIENISKIRKTLGSIRQVKKIIKEFKPDLVIGTGGYICISVCGAAKAMRVPFIIHESNVLPGKATRVLSKDAEKILVGFKEAKERLPRAKEVVLTGTPTKGENLNYDDETKKNKKKELGFDKNKPLILVFGGSQGSRTINGALSNIVIDRHKNPDKKANYQIMWATGPSQYDIVKEKLSGEGIDIDNIEGAKIEPYIYDIGKIMNIADLIVCRSGAMTVTELEKIGKASILIPFPYAAENHQEYNARALENENASRVVLDRELKRDVLDGLINELVSQPELIKEMGNNSKKLSINNVEDKIYTEIRSALSER